MSTIDNLDAIKHRFYEEIRNKEEQLGAGHCKDMSEYMHIVGQIWAYKNVIQELNVVINKIDSGEVDD